MSNRVSQSDDPVGTNAQYAQLPTDDPSASMAQPMVVSETIALELSDGIEHTKTSSADAVVGHRRSYVEAHQDLGMQWAFVEAKWFHGIIVSALLASTIMVGLELNDAHLVDSFMAPNLCVTGLLFFELWVKFLFYGRLFLCDRATYVIWNVLDIVIVIVALTDSLLTFRPLNVEDGNIFSKTLTLVRFLRILQIAKILNIVLDYDLSWSDAPWFQSFIGFVIGFNALLMGFETDVESSVWAPIEQCLLTVYTAELLVRMKKQGILPFMSYENNDFVWNWLDLIIVASSAADSWGVGMMQLFMHAMEDTKADMKDHKKKQGMNLAQVMMLMRMLRLLRILRLVKLVKAVKPLYILVMGVSSAVQGVFWVLVLTIVILYAMSIIATRLIGHGLVFEGHAKPEAADLAVFGTVPDSMFTLFRVMSGAQSEEESMKMEALMSTLPSMKFAFVFFLVTSSWTLLSILTAVVSEKMIGTCNDEQAEMSMLSYEEDRSRHMEELKTLFLSLDRDHNGWLELKELEPVLSDPTMAGKIAHICRVPVRNVRDCFHTLSRHGEHCPLDTFVASMLEVAKPATEQSVMKILAQILDAQMEVEKTRTAHQEQIEGLLSVVREAEQKHHDIMLDLEKKNAEQERRHAEAILEMEQKNAAQEQRHAEAVIELEQKNSATIKSVLDIVNALAVRQEAHEQTRLARDNDMSSRLSGMEVKNKGALKDLHCRVESLACVYQHSTTPYNGSKLVADDKPIEQISNDAGDQEHVFPLQSSKLAADDKRIEQISTDVGDQEQRRLLAERHRLAAEQRRLLEEGRRKKIEQFQDSQQATSSYDDLQLGISSREATGLAESGNSSG